MTQRITRRGFLGATASIGGGVLLAGCGGSRSGGGGSGGGEVVYNTFLDPADTKDPRAIAQTAAINAFQQANPNIKIQVSVDPGGSNVSKAIAARAGTPDVFRVQNLTVRQFVAQRGLAPLDEYIDRDGVDRDDWLLPLSFNQIEGKTYSLQQDFRIPVLLYRADALKRAGFDKPPTTFEDVASMAGGLSGAGKVPFPVGFGSSGGFFAGQPFLEFFGGPLITQSSGGTFFAEDGRAAAFSAGDVEKVAAVVKDLYAKKASTPAALNWGYTEIQQALQTGSASSAVFGLYRFNTLKSSGASDLAWAPAPSNGTAGKQTVYGQAMAINNASENKDAAWAFVKFMTSPETQAGLAAGGEVVSRKSAYDDPYFKRPEAANLVAWRNLVEERGQNASYSIYYSTFGEIMSSALTRMVLENGTSSAAAAEIMTKYADKLRG